MKLSSAAQEKLGSLSGEQTRLLKLLLERKSSRTQQIKRYSRVEGAQTTRLPASWAQQRMWFIDQLAEGHGGYVIPALAVRLRGALDRDALQLALDALVDRHEALRTAFVSVQGEPAQEVASAGRFALQVVDLSGYSKGEREVQVRVHAREEAHQQFDLRAGALVRGRLLCLQSQEHVLLITMHHIICDGWSIRLFIRELGDLYTAYTHGQGDPLQPLPIQYADYAQWQREWLQGEYLERQLSYWRARLAGAGAELELPTDRPRPAVQSYHGANVSLVLEGPLSAGLKAFAQQHKMTLFMVLYAGLAILLSRLSGQEDVVLGTPIANRQRPELEGLLGLFVNTLALRASVQGESRLETFLEQIKEVTLGAYNHQDAPLEKVVEAVQPQRSLSRAPLFQVMFVLHNEPRSELCLPGLAVTFEEDVDESSILDLWISLEERGDRLVGSVNYATDLFDRQTIERWMACFKVVLRGMVDAGSGAFVGELPILADSDRDQVVRLFNATATPYPQEKLVHEVFEGHVRQAPDALAVVFEEQSLTYAELNRKANQFAHYLLGQGVRAGECIPILMPRCLHNLIAQLAVLKSGGIYVPIDPQLPEARQQFMIRDCAARRIIVGEQVAFEGSSLQSIDYGEVAPRLAELPGENPSVAMDALGAAVYVMYTSGSTGMPKGVIVPHRGVNRLVVNNGYADINATDCIAHCSNPAFDASTFEIWAALLNGARLFIVPHSLAMDTAGFAAALRHQGVTILFQTTALFNQRAGESPEIFAGLRYLFFGGEAADPGAARRVLRSGHVQNLLNAYGPTESTTYATTCLIRGVGEGAKGLPIGRPIANTQIYILDAWRRPVPIGTIGEIYIGGAGVALGYLNRPELTAERFVADHFSADRQARLYRTGDLGRWRADGNIDFVGRNDQQVKIRGLRIELGEIEAQLLRHDHVREAVVLAREDAPGDKRLVAYIVFGEGPRPSVEGLRESLREVLPEYMVPGAIVALESLPLTANGKVDRRALPAPEADAYASQHYEAPRGEIEEALAQLWQEVLHVSSIGREDNFFALGGHSLDGLKLVSSVGRSFRVRLPVAAVFQYPTIALMAKALEGALAVAEPSRHGAPQLEQGVL